jgi:hypothetical protein
MAARNLWAFLADPGPHRKDHCSANDLYAKLAQPVPVRNDAHMVATEDRRRKRSEDPLVALHYQLAHARKEGKLDAIVVADDSGVVVAAAGSWAACEELAAYAPLLAQGVWSEPGAGRLTRMAELRTEVDVQPVDVEGQTVLLCARGGMLRASAMERAAGGVARILKRAA